MTHFPLFVILLIPLFTDSGPPQLSYFEILKDSDISHSVIKRGVSHSYHKYNTIKEVSFKALGKNFRLILNPTQGLLASRFKAYSVDKHGNKKSFSVDKDHFFEGRLFGEKSSQVSAHIDGNLITASIRTPEDDYAIEPAWRHILDGNNNISMVIYRSSDVKYSRNETTPKFCYDIPMESNSETNVETSRDNLQIETRSENLKIEKTRCSLLLVADYRFFASMGGSNLKATANYLIALIDRINKIYMESEWKGSSKEDIFSGMGFVIKDVLIHTEPSSATQDKDHYNAPREIWDPVDLLQNFSRLVNPVEYCLAHLFTDQSFTGKTLGLAFVASNRLYASGGICSKEIFKGGSKIRLNVGFSTSRNYYGARVVTREADLVTAHEFGHNWGSVHDPDTPECSPSSYHGGSYIMYAYVVSGYNPNNNKFSPCSVRSIRSVLLRKSWICFSKAEVSFCGNSLVENGEECDAGLIGEDKEDPCCDTSCKLRDNAACSDKNSLCCHGCQYTKAGEICRDAQPVACKREAYCNGKSPVCPPSSPQPNNTLCLDSGRCFMGQCIPFCETLSYMSCTCDEEEHTCKRCCRRSSNDSCHPMEPVEILRDGTPCRYGYCDQGRCKETVQDIVERFWKFIEYINVNKLLKFLNDNIVGTIIIVSIIIWMPASCVVNRIDNKRRQEYLEFLESRYRGSVVPFQVPKEGFKKIIHLRQSPQNSTMPYIVPE